MPPRCAHGDLLAAQRCLAGGEVSLAGLARSAATPVAVLVLLFVVVALLAGGWSRRQWPLLLSAVLLVATQVSLGITTLRLGWISPWSRWPISWWRRCWWVFWRRWCAAPRLLLLSPVLSSPTTPLWSPVMAEAISAALPTRDQVVPSRKRVKLPPWLEVAKPRLIPLLLATTLGGMALTEGWPCRLPVWSAPWAAVLASVRPEF